VTTATTNELRNCYGCVDEVPGIIHGLLRLCHELLRSCYDIAGSDTLKPRLHYGVNGILWLCNGSAKVSTVITRFGRLNVCTFKPFQHSSLSFYLHIYTLSKTRCRDKDCLQTMQLYLLPALM